MPGLESDLVNFVKAIPAFYNPILNFYSPPKLITDPIVLARIAYNRLPQSNNKPVNLTDASPPPALTWKGPYNSEIGQTSPWVPDPLSPTVFKSTTVRTQVFWFFLYHQTQTAAIDWGQTIQEALSALQYPYNLSSYRLTAALFKDLAPVQLDQTQITGKEYPTQCATIGYEFGYQPKP